MEELGFAVDKAGIAEYGEIMQNKIDRLQDLVYEEVGYRFNLNSPKQLGEALFIKLGLPAGKRQKQDTPPMQKCWKNFVMNIPWWN